MGLGAAVVGAGALGLAGSAIQASAAKSAASEQASAAEQGLSLQESMFNQAKGALSPYYLGGDKVDAVLQRLLTPGTRGNTLENLPGLKFQTKWGDIGATNALSAQGLGGSTGPLASAISQYNQGLGNTYYNNYVSQLQNRVGIGANAAGALAGNATASGANQANTLAQLGSAQASGTLGSANAIAGGLGSAGSSITNALLLSKLLGSSNGGIFGGATAAAS